MGLSAAALTLARKTHWAVRKMNNNTNDERPVMSESQAFLFAKIGVRWAINGIKFSYFLEK